MIGHLALRPLRLGVNIDHVATLRNARGGQHPDPVGAARLAFEAGADGITAHLREDRRHIRDMDVERLLEQVPAPLNLEMAATPAMVALAERWRPHAACLVPERRAEITTEGGLGVAGNEAALVEPIGRLTAAGCRVSLFIDAEPRQIEAAKAVGAPVIELHTGSYCEAETGASRTTELDRLRDAAKLAERLGLECHAGHGLSFATVRPVAAIPTIVELNIGHFLMGEALFMGLAQSIGRMRALMEAGRRDIARQQPG